MSGKSRLSASVDSDLLAAAESAVASGRAANVSSWVNEALRLKLEHDQRLAAMAAFIQEYERERGVIGPDDLRRAARRARSRAIVIRPDEPPARRKRGVRKR